MTTDAVVAHFAHLTLRARALEFSAPAITLGSVTLLPHQTAAVHWLLHRIRRYGGALLADPPGLGKTYVALAVATARGTQPLVIAPASLRTRWMRASDETGVAIDFVSTERLSAPPPTTIGKPAFVIIDEAHHLRTPGTRRFQRSADLCAGSVVLLLSATPIHNRERDLQHISTLFHLPPSRASAHAVRQRLTLRRSLAVIHAAGGRGNHLTELPVVRTRENFALRISHSPAPALIAALPPLAGESAESHRLIQLGLLHALRSSGAAAVMRIRRRIAATLAIEHAARDNVELTADVRRAFITDGVDVQLAMPALLSTPARNPDPRLRQSARRHRKALEVLVRDIAAAGDDDRVHFLRRLARWCTSPVVAFTQFNATAESFYKALRCHAGIAWLGGTTAHITSGVISRDDVLDRLLSLRYRGRHDGVRLLITTDVVSEGLSLAGVGTIVHLDLPWTAARLDQRIGRAARIGATVLVVNVVNLPAPLADVHDGVRSLVARKRRRMALVDGDDDAEIAVIRALTVACAATRHDAGRRRWASLSPAGQKQRVIVAEVRVGRNHWLVAVDANGVRRVRVAEWRAIASGVVMPAEPRLVVASKLACRRALRASAVERELTTIVSDARDHRLHTRRDADERLLQVDRWNRTLFASDATRMRRRIMQSRHDLLADTRDMPEVSTSAAIGDAGTHRRREVDAIRVLAGITLLPAHEPSPRAST